MELRHNNVAEGCSETDCKVACTMQNEMKFQSTLKRSTLQKEYIPFGAHYERAHPNKSTLQEANAKKRKEHMPKRAYVEKSTCQKEHRLK